MKKLGLFLFLVFCLTGVATASDMIKAAGSTFVNSAGEEINTAPSAKIIGFYFANDGSTSASFTRNLINFYSDRKQAGHDFEIIHVGSYKNTENMMQHMRDIKMPWLAVPRASKEASDLRQIKRQGSLGTIIPVLIIVRDGQIITEFGRKDVQELGLKAYEKWLTMPPENAAFQEPPSTPTESNSTAQKPQSSKDEKDVQSQKSISSSVDFDAVRKTLAAGSKQDQDGYFNLCARYIQDAYDSLKTNRYIVWSYKSKEKTNTLNPNYALRIETFLNKIPPPVPPGSGAVVATSNGLQATVDKIYSDDTSAIFVTEGSQQKRVSIAELPASSQLLATALVANQLFERKFEIVVNKEDPHRWEGSSTPSFGGAKESYTYTETPYNIVLANQSDSAVDNLILEYQIFFKQTLAGAKLDAQADYRFVGYKAIKAIPANFNLIIKVTPPPITESKLVGGGSGDVITYLYYPTDCHQVSSGRIRGVWVRVHRITPYGRQTIDFKDGTSLDDAEWTAIGIPPASFVNHLFPVSQH